MPKESNTANFGFYGLVVVLVRPLVQPPLLAGGNGKRPATLKIRQCRRRLYFFAPVVVSVTAVVLLLTYHLKKAAVPLRQRQSQNPAHLIYRLPRRKGVRTFLTASPAVKPPKTPNQL